jgi:hypothetical protein
LILFQLLFIKSSVVKPGQLVVIAQIEHFRSAFSFLYIAAGAYDLDLPGAVIPVL